MISNKKILITGGAGFIGSNLCDYFIAKNNHIICFDNFSTGKKDCQRKKNVLCTFLAPGNGCFYQNKCK